jgi:hypothetical protein
MSHIMIQRIQSLYLSLIFLLSLFLFTGSFLSFKEESGSNINLKFLGIFRDSGSLSVEKAGDAYPITIGIILIPVISMLTLVLFKNRKIQLKLAGLLIVLSLSFIVLSVLYVWIIITKYQSEVIPGIKMLIAGIILICSVLAYRGIKKDDNLVKSYDRLR